MVLSLVESTVAYAIGASGPVVLGSFRLKAEPESVRAFTRTCAAVKAKYSHFAMIGTAEEEAAPPESIVRQSIADLFRAYAGRLVGVAFLIEGTGFRASLLRGITTGLTAMSRDVVPYKVVPTALEGSQWIVARLHPLDVRDLPLPATLATDLEQLRRSPISEAVGTGAHSA